MNSKIINIIFFAFFLLLGQLGGLQAQSETSFAREGNDAFSNEKYGEAEILFKKSLRANPTSDLDQAIFNLGNSLYAQERYEEAADQFSQATAQIKNPIERANAFYNCGNAYLSGSKLEESIASYKEALKLNPSDYAAKYNLAYAQSLLKNQEDSNCNNPNEDPEKQDEENQEEKENQEQQDQEQQEQKDQEQQEQESQEEEKDQEEQENQEQQEQDGESEEKEEEQPEPGEEENEEQKEQDPSTAPEPKDEMKKGVKMTREEMMRLLEATKNEEQKVQEKLFKQQGKSKNIKSDKDW